MARGFAGAKKVGQSKGRGDFPPKPKGVNYFSLRDGQTAVVRFLQIHEEVEWTKKWKLGVFPNQQLANCIDVHEDGTPDPGYALGLKSIFKAYPTLIWRNAPQYQKNADGTLFKDANGNKVQTGIADQVALWECSFDVYATLQELDAKYQGLMSRDFEIKRIGADKTTKYMILPDGDASQFSPADQQLAATQRIDASQFTKIPSYDELSAFLSGGEPQTQPQGFTQQAVANAQPVGAANPFLS